MRPALFFDRDGTLNQEVGYAGRPEDFHIFPYAAEAVRRVNQAGWAAVVVTNQAGVARGFYSEEAIAVLHGLLRDHMAAAGAHLDAIYYCPHHPRGEVAGYGGACACRKPAPGMLRQAERELGLDLRRSWVVGDRDLDVGLAHAVGARGALVRSGYGETALAAGPAYPPDHVAEDALTAVEWILAREVQP
ncbi:MAG TPA: HAD family hydrolase [Terriglobales bacterium]|jgi:D-glycero-D-manno-heptose 1,7-bisphosphate phosphatase